MTLVDHFMDDEYVYLVSKWVSGCNLVWKALNEGGDFYLTENEMRQPLSQLLSALHNLHKLGYAHNSVIPEHIILERPHG